MISEDENSELIESKPEINYKKLAIKYKCERDHLYFTRYFFKVRNQAKFLINFHHVLISDAIEKVIKGETKNLVINIPPGAGKTELVVINLIARGLAINPRSRFLHLSYSDSLATLNSEAARDLIALKEYQDLWIRKVAPDSNAKSRWNVTINNHKAGGVYATSIGGQVTGFRAGHIDKGFSGVLIVDDPLKPTDAFSKVKVNDANRRLITTVMSRKAAPHTPVILIMQRICENDPTGFIKNGNLPGEWEHLVIPALITKEYIEKLPEHVKKYVDINEPSEDGRYSYWNQKEKVKDLISMERGEKLTSDSQDKEGSKISKFVFNAQYQQNPVSMGGNIIKGEYFKTYKVLPKILYRKIYADTAQKTGEKNDYTVFGCYGKGIDGQLYVLDILRGKFEAPELLKRAIAFWNKNAAYDRDKFGTLQKLVVEDKSSGTGLIQTLKNMNSIPVEAVQRNKDKLMRLNDVLPYIEQGMISLPENADFVSDFIDECESFNADFTHAHDDILDTLIDAINDMLYSGSKIKQWERLAQ